VSNLLGLRWYIPYAQPKLAMSGRGPEG
jgi:hypothetical protein